MASTDNATEKESYEAELSSIDAKIEYLEELEEKINDAKIKLNEDFRKEATSLGIDPDEMEKLAQAQTDL